MGWVKGGRRYTATAAQHIEIRTALNDWIVTQTEAQLIYLVSGGRNGRGINILLVVSGAGFQLTLSLTVLVVREVGG